MCCEENKIQHLIGRTLVSATIVKATDGVDSEVRFEDTDGRRYKLFHEQDVSEDVWVEDVVGDLSDLIGSPIIQAERVTTEGVGDPKNEDDNGSGTHTWTFFKLATNKGSVTIRFYGSSNGYYAEDATFAIVDEAEELKEAERMSGPFVFVTDYAAALLRQQQRILDAMGIKRPPPESHS